ncbi:hypothetical protein [Planococcus versutus]|uniref:DUF695 domain-containing protein n=1 Tax=Planococcus versutus TaxID=1302659 RepID=A0A1B1RZL0_9BACL|nr:hypothetical protein [Planococcus versutus]ANU26381.1 hypothetical protein I858_004950 [Planococcus versutus]
MNWLPMRKNKVAAFWDWFVTNKAVYHKLDDKNSDKRLNQLQKKLQKVNQHLTFELSDLSEDAKRELVISADGMIEAFDDVIELVEQAPELDAFKVIAFRQQQTEEVSIDYGDIELSWHDMFYTVEKQESRDDFNLTLYVKGFTKENEDEFVSASFILLDTVIGEYNAGMCIGEIEFASYERQPNLLPIKELQSLF